MRQVWGLGPDVGFVRKVSMLPCSRVIGLVMVMSLSWGTLDACCGSKGHAESSGAPGVLGSRHSPGWGLRSIL